MRSNRLQAILRHYRENHQSRREDELDFFASRSSLRSAIETAAIAENRNGRRFGHQCRLSSGDLEQARNALLAREQRINTAKSFDELHAIVLEAAMTVWSNPELYAYDTAVRIGANLRLSPDKVYLHRGTRVGARNLGLDVSKSYLQLAELPAEFQALQPNTVEDILCIYKDEFIKSEE